MWRSKRKGQTLLFLKSEIGDRLSEVFPRHHFQVHLSSTKPHVVDVVWTGGPSEKEVRFAIRFSGVKVEYQLLEVACSRVDG